MSILNDPPAAPTESVGSPEGNTAAAPTTPTTSWRDSLPEDMRSEKSFETIPGTTVEEALPNLAKQYLNAQQMVGADKLVIPGENATPEQTNEFFTKLGRPAEAKDYEMVLPEGLDESTLDTAQIDKWKDRFHEAGISAKVAKEFLSQHISEEFARNQQAQQGVADQLQSWELEAKETFGDKIPPLSSTKPLCGHALGAAGVHEAIYSLIMLREGFIAPSANIQDLDEGAEGYPIVRERMDNQKLDLVMSNSFGFGGTNASLVFKKV